MSFLAALHLRRAWKSDRGQVLPVVALMLVALLGMAALVLDMGHAFYCYRELQAATDAAALAGAANIGAGTAVATAFTYSALPGKLNARANLPNVSMVYGYPMLRCSTTMAAQGMACVAPINANVIVVRQQAVVQMYFAGLFGHPTITVSATATAAIKGASNTPANIAIIVDTTPSMLYFDSDGTCNNYRLLCAMTGVRTLLSTLSPCGTSLSSCGTVTNGNVANPVDKVALFTFPGVTSSTVQDESNCSGVLPTAQPYSYPVLPTYQMTGFQSDYRVSNSTTTLSTGSPLTTAAWGNGTCYGIVPILNPIYDTYFTGAIMAAQAALVAASQPHTKNVMIFLSDGDSNAPMSSLPGASATSGVYPSQKNQCQQAVTAAQAAAAAGTIIYSVAYGSTSAGCSTDTSGITPCQTMQRIASQPQNFFSDYTSAQGDGSCTSAAQPTTSLNQIFQQIAAGLTVARLIPDNTP